MKYIESRYIFDGMTAIQMLTDEGEPWCTVSVNPTASRLGFCQ